MEDCHALPLPGYAHGKSGEGSVDVFVRSDALHEVVVGQDLGQRVQATVEGQRPGEDVEGGPEHHVALRLGRLRKRVFARQLDGHGILRCDGVQGPLGSQIGDGVDAAVDGAAVDGAVLEVHGLRPAATAGSGNHGPHHGLCVGVGVLSGHLQRREGLRALRQRTQACPELSLHLVQDTLVVPRDALLASLAAAGGDFQLRDLMTEHHQAVRANLVLRGRPDEFGFPRVVAVVVQARNEREFLAVASAEVTQGSCERGLPLATWCRDHIIGRGPHILV
mmetsp:Transcript_44650/g.126261  ORF Transcript_44650/g.126261 Transcript_44650/m.126261 type:complete len:278 (-) Transcript_44650:122-955(-)